MSESDHQWSGFDIRIGIAASPGGECQIQNHTTIQYLLMSLWFWHSQTNLPRYDTNVTTGTLAAALRDALSGLAAMKISNGEF